MVSYAAPNESPTVILSVRYRVTHATGSSPVVKIGSMIGMILRYRTLFPARIFMVVVLHSFPTRADNITFLVFWSVWLYSNRAVIYLLVTRPHICW